jgi:hypothetical protein
VRSSRWGLVEASVVHAAGDIQGERAVAEALQALSVEQRAWRQ